METYKNQVEMGVYGPGEMFSVSSSITLSLHGSGDHNGNAFSVSSSSPSSSSCPGELSPESLRSLSSRSRTDSPLDFDMLEVTPVAKTGKRTVEQWFPQEKDSKKDGEDEDVLAGKLQAAMAFLSESNNNSTSVYLDADSGKFHDDSSRNNNQMLLRSGHQSSDGRRQFVSSDPDSNATEVPDDDDEDEGLSLSSERDIKNSVSPKGSTPLTPGDPAEDAPLLDSAGQSQTEPCAFEDLSDPTRVSASCHTASDLVLDAQHVSTSPAPAAPPPPTGPCSKPTQAGSRQKTRPATKTSSLEAKRRPKLDRSIASIQKPASQNHVEGKIAGLRTREEVQSPNETRRCTTSTPQRGSMVLKPVKGRSCGFRTRTGTGPTVSDLCPQPQKKKKSETLSTLSSFLVSEVLILETKPSDEKEVEIGRTHSRKVSSRPGPRGLRVDGGPSRPAPPPGSGTGPPGPAPTGPRLGGEGRDPAGVSPNTVRQSLSQSQGIPKPRVTTERVSALSPSNTCKSAANQQPASVSAGRPAAPSKLPVKELPTSLGCSSLGSNRNNGPSRKVDKNKPARSINNHNQQWQKEKQQQQQKQKQQKQQNPSDQVPEMVNTNVPVMFLPADPGSGSTGAPRFGTKARSGSRSSPKTAPRLQNVSRPADWTANQNQSSEQAEKKNQAVTKLRKLLVQGNKRVEALALVIQHLFTECEETLKQTNHLSVELSTLRNKLAASSLSCEELQKEKEEVRLGMEETLKKLEEQHRDGLEQLENRLRSFYQTEWDKVHQTYQEEADKCRILMEQQVEELRSQQEVERKNQEVSHSRKMQSLQQQHDTSIQELKKIQQKKLENLEKILKETEASLSGKISELLAENEDLNEQLKAEEVERQCLLSDKSLKDSHTVYLEQELESLKVVLEIKNNQLHQKEKKIMEMDKLVETNVKLEECLKKVQQENEDYKARMDKHAAISKQLSSEQAKLQQTLRKESTVNKRLSMENEELLWKLHNGDLLASPRHLSPTSPFGSPRSAASFPTAAPVSPR